MLNKPILRNTFMVVCLLSTSLLLACATGQVHFRRSWDVSRTFESFEIVPGYKYYYNGLPSTPDAIVGISKNYELDSPYWHSMEINEKEMRHVIGEILNTPGVVPDKLEAQGAKILNNHGEVIGIWYSAWKLPTITFKTDKKFYMSQPWFQIPAPNQEHDDFDTGGM